MSNSIKVEKRNGSIELIDIEKIHTMVEHACEGLSNVSASQVEMNANIQFYDGIKTSEIQEILVRSASDLITLDNPNYQFVAARLLLFGLRKHVFGQNWKVAFPSVADHLRSGIESKIYDKSLVHKYTPEDWEKIDSFIDHDRDFLFTYAGLRQVVDKYLVQDRSSATIFETPQYM
jgi:ribonucleoside-diphosphate reductase alpha chain